MVLSGAVTVRVPFLESWDLLGFLAGGGGGRH